MAVEIHLTTHCNMNCRYCFGWDNKTADKCISHKLEDVRRMLDDAKAVGNKYVTLSGGEPFLYKEIFEVIKYAHDLGYAIVILTNGVLIDKETIEKLRQYWRIRVRVSLDGARKETHEYFRGKDSFDRAIQVIKNLSKNRINVGVGFTAYEENLNEIEDIVKLCIDCGCSFLRFAPVARVSKGKNAAVNVNLYETIIEKVIRATLKYKNFIDFSSSDSNSFILPTEFMTTKKCPAGKDFFLINPEGLFMPCPLILSGEAVYTKQYQSKDDFFEMSRKMDDLLEDVKNNIIGECRDCEYLGVCYGGCLGEKISFGMNIYDSQPVCMKNILENVFKKFDAKDINMLMRSWTQELKRSIEEFGGDRVCMRYMPFWTIRFKHFSFLQHSGGL